MQDIVNASSEAAEVLMNGMLESKRLQLSAQNASETEVKTSRPVLVEGDTSVYPKGTVPEKPLIDGLFEPKMPPRPLLEMAKENYEALQALAEQRTA